MLLGSGDEVFLVVLLSPEVDLDSVIVFLESSDDPVASSQYTGKVHVDGHVGVRNCSCDGSNVVVDDVAGGDWQAGQQ